MFCFLYYYQNNITRLVENKGYSLGLKLDFVVLKKRNKKRKQHKKPTKKHTHSQMLFRQVLLNTGYKWYFYHF